MARQIWIRLGVILLLAFLPFILFFGESGSVTENGRIIQDRRINYLGVILAGIGLVLALLLIIRRSLSERLDALATPLRARVMAGFLALLCAGQMAVSADLVRPRQVWIDLSDKLSDSMAIWRGLQPPPPRSYAGLSPGDRSGYTGLGEEDDEPALRELIAISGDRK